KAIDEFMETAGFPVRGFFLVEKGEAGLVELVEELLPGDVIEAFVLEFSGSCEEARVSQASLILRSGVAALRSGPREAQIKRWPPMGWSASSRSAWPLNPSWKRARASRRTAARSAALSITAGAPSSRSRIRAGSSISTALRCRRLRRSSAKWRDRAAIHSPSLK